MKYSLTLLLPLVAVLSNAFAAEAVTSAAAPDGAAAMMVAADTPLGSGPDKALMEADPALPTHTVYRPVDLAALGAEKLPVVAWANGGCVNTGNRFRWFLTELASYGFLVIAIGPIGPPSAEYWPSTPVRPATVAPPLATPPQLPSHGTHPSQLIDAIDWALSENERDGSQYYHRLDTHKIAVMGQSCGGVQAIEASADPRVSTTVVWNSGLFTTPSRMGGGKLISKDDLAKLHASTAYISGDSQDIAFLNANVDFAHLKTIPAFRAYEQGVPHVATYREPNGGEFGGVGVAWLQWQLKGNARAAKMFLGADCGLCVNPRWVVKKANLK